MPGDVVAEGQTSWKSPIIIVGVCKITSQDKIDVRTSLFVFIKFQKQSFSRVSPLVCSYFFSDNKLSKFPIDFKPRLHERFFACDGDAIFSGNCRVAGARWWLHERQSLWFCREKFNSFNFSWFFFCNFLAVAIAALARGRLHVWFSPCADNTTNLEKIAPPSQAKNRSCSRSFRIGKQYNNIVISRIVIRSRDPGTGTRILWTQYPPFLFR